MRVVKSNGVRKARQIYKVGYARTKTSRRGARRKKFTARNNLGRWLVKRLPRNLRMRQDKTERGTAPRIVLIQS